MAGARIEVEVTTPALDRAARDLSQDGLEDLLRDLGEYLLRSTRERAGREVSPDGAVWRALSPRYKRAKEKKRAGLPILAFDRHMLGDRLAFQVEGDSVLVGTSALYGAIHQFGGTVKIPARETDLHFKRDSRTGEVGQRFVKPRYSQFSQRATIPAHQVRIPARPWLGLSTEDEDEVRAIVQLHINRMLDASDG